jgi:hypothetical protein
MGSAVKPNLKRCPFRWQCPVSSPTTHLNWSLLGLNRSFVLLSEGPSARNIHTCNNRRVFSMWSVPRCMNGSLWVASKVFIFSLHVKWSKSRSEFLTMMILKDTIFWILMPCILETTRRFGEIHRPRTSGSEKKPITAYCFCWFIACIPLQTWRSRWLLRNVVLSLNYRELQSSGVVLFEGKFMWLMTLDWRYSSTNS